MLTRGTVLKIAAVVLLLGVAAGGYAAYSLGTNFQSPELRSVQNEFVNATADHTNIRTNVVVYNPNDRAIPDAAQLRYRVLLNDVPMGQAATRVGLQPGNNSIELRTQLNNEKIPKWWVTHINNGERTVMSLRPSVSIPVAPVGADLPARNRTIETDLLSALNSNEFSTVRIANTTILEVGSQRASWGEATMESTPIIVRTDLRNVHDEPIRLAGTQYRILMNGVVVGEGRTDDAFSLASGKAGTLTVRPTIDTPRMRAWWVNHIQNGEQTRLQIQVYGLVRDDGELTRVPLTIYAQDARIQTNLLGDGDTSVELLQGGNVTDGFSQPRVVETDSRWGEAGDDRTEILSEMTVRNPNDGSFGDVIELSLTQTTMINGVRAASGTATVDGLAAGNNSVSLTSHLVHDTVPEWWARHLNAGEESTVVVESRGTADVGVTTLEFEAGDRKRTIETNVLASYNSTEDQRVQQDGRTVLVVTRTSMTWGEATRAEAPVNARVTVENHQARPVTITDITYTVSLNDIALADNRTVDESYSIAPASRETITPTLVVANARMEDWWPTHVRRDETSTLSVEVYATVESAFGSKRVRLDSVSGNSTMSTDLLGDE